MMKTALLSIVAILATTLAFHADAADKDGELEIASLRIGEDGKLEYVPDQQGNLIPDFSRAGYMGGGVKLPDVPVKMTLEPRPGMERALAMSPPEAGQGDDTERIQAAIDKVSAMPLDKDGFRGAVLLKSGLYRTSTTLRIQASGVVLRGEGQAKDGTVILCTSDQQTHMITLSGNRKITEVPNSRVQIADAYVPWGATSFNLKSADGFSVGDKVIVLRPNSKQWLDDLKMTKIWRWEAEPHAFDLYYEREIVAVEGKHITLDAPIVCAMEDKYGGGFVYRYTEEGATRQVGVEHLRLISTGGAHVGVSFECVLNSWARNITGLNLHQNLIAIGGTGNAPSKFVTVQDCAYIMGCSQRGSKSGFIFRDAQFCLIQRGYTDTYGRHCNSCSRRVKGPNVYLDMVNKGWDVGPHARWSTGILYDNVYVRGYLVARNRGNMGSGHGWAGAQIVFWNCATYKANIGQPPGARNYRFGGSPKLKYGRNVVGSAVEPRSLYLQQLEDRLGKQAVANVTTEPQRKAVNDPTSEFSKRDILWDVIRLGIGEETAEDKGLVN